MTSYDLGVWTEREGGDWEACVICSYLEGLIWGGVTNFPLGVYTQAEREASEWVTDEPQDLAATDRVSLGRYGVQLRKLSTGTLDDALSRVDVGLVLAGRGSLNIATAAELHCVFVIPKANALSLVFDPLAPNQSAGVLTANLKILGWAKGAGPNDAREVKKDEFSPPAPIPPVPVPPVDTVTRAEFDALKTAFLNHQHGKAQA
jgi:hypothetical protein